MTKQHVDYAGSPFPVATLDTGTTDATAIRPIVNGEVATQATLQRPDENLRTRTEIIRTELEQLKYLSDADRALVMSSTGPVTWNGVVGGGGNGKFTLPSGQTMTVRPLLAPLVSTAAKIINRGVKFETNLSVAPGPTNPPRAYGSANKYNVQFVNNAAVNVVVTYDPLLFRFTISTDTRTGSNCRDKDAVILAFNTAASSARQGITATVDSGAGGDKFAEGSTFIQGAPADYMVFSGAADAEKHVITQAGLVTFFADPLNVLIEGDVLAIGYDKIVSGLFTGRRESLNDAPEASFNEVDGNLFVMRRSPEKLPIAIPVCFVIDDKLVFADGTIAAKALATTFTGGAAELPAPVAPETPAKFLRMRLSGIHTWENILTDMVLSILSISNFASTVAGDGPSPSNGIFEIGKNVIAPTFTATTIDDGLDGPTTAVLTNNDNVESKNVQPDFGGLSTGGFSSANSYLKNSQVANGSVTFTLTAADAATPATRQASLSWYRRVYWGFNATDPLIGNYTNTFLKTTVGGGGTPTTRSALKSGKSFSFSLSAPGSPRYVFFAYPARHGAVTSILDNINGLPALAAFTEVDPGAAGITTETAGVNPANVGGIVDTAGYRVYRSNALQTGPVNFTVN